MFNIGINENATIAEKFGNNGPQEKNNIDNYKAMAEYYRRFKKLNFDFQPKSSKRNFTIFRQLDNKMEKLYFNYFFLQAGQLLLQNRNWKIC